MKRAESLLGFAQRAGALVSGETAVLISLRRSLTRLLIVAEDASHNTQDRLLSLAKRRNIPCVRLGTRESLGLAIGKSPRSALAIEDAHFARTIHEFLREEN